MNIRKANAKDIPECVPLCQIPEFEEPSGEFPDEESLTKALNHIFLVAEEDNKIIGLIQGFILTENEVYLDLLTIKKEHRNKNIGSQLIQAFRKELKKEGIKEFE